MKNKKERLLAIREIVTEKKIGSQDDLLKLLVEKGFDLTQATLSRDLKQLQIAKVADKDGSYVYILPEMGGVGKIVHTKTFGDGSFGASGFISIEFSNHVAVIRTRPGYASSIAYDIDVASPREILGTIAGDDTILLIPREEYTREEIIKALSVFIPNIQLK
ncbi:MAG: arginine repressor [Bacteroidales bacterium]|nr:arginine repressor [Bacteroidales bacterium]